MGNRVVALSLVLSLGLAGAGLAAEEGADGPAVLPLAGEGARAQAAPDTARQDDPAATPSDTPAMADDGVTANAPVAGADAPQVTAADDGADPAASDAPAVSDASADSGAPEETADSVAATGDAEPAEDMIIAPIGEEALEAPEADETLLAGTFPAVDPTAPACREDTILLRGDFGKARFSVEVADDGPERAQGLMHVKSMPPSFGMLFVYPSARPASFWMKNTLIPLDMIFADQHGVVQRVHSMAKPQDLTQIHGGDNIQYVLEINGGMANMLGIKPGTQMRHPAITDPAWRCQ